MEKQVYIIKGSITSLLLANLQLWGPFLFQIKKGQSVTLSTPKSVWDFNINNSCLPLLILTHNMEYTTWFWQISMLVYHTAFEINSCLFLHKKHNDQKNAPNNDFNSSRYRFDQSCWLKLHILRPVTIWNCAVRPTNMGPFFTKKGINIWKIYF